MQPVKESRAGSHAGAPPAAVLRPIVDAVCAELGIAEGENERRRAVARRVALAYSRGRRQPLNLVDAGLGGREA